MSSSFKFKFYCHSHVSDELSSFEELSPAQLKEAANLDQEQFPNPWLEKKWQQIKKGELGPCLLALLYKEEVLIGFSLFGISDPDSAHLYKILIFKRERGGAISRDLMRRCESILRSLKFKSVYLEVEQSNLRALGFYQKHGYQVLVEKKGFYGAGRHAFALEHILS